MAPIHPIRTAFRGRRISRSANGCMMQRYSATTCLKAWATTPLWKTIVAWGEYDATIKQLTEELGLGPQEYTPGGKVDGYGLDDEEEKASPESPIVPVAGRLNYNTETGNYVDDYNYAGNDKEGKQEIEDTYRDLLNMNYDQKVDFAYSDAGKEYFLGIERYATPEEKKRYLTVLFGDTYRYEMMDNGEIIVLTAPDVSDPTSKFWDTHVKPEDFNPRDPDLGDVPLKPEIMDLHPVEYYDSSMGTTIELSKGTYSDLAEDAYERYGRYIGNHIDPYNNLLSVLSGEGLEPGANLLVEYGKKFAGKLPYVWGGKKLHEGADCSGFVFGIYNDFGIKIPRGTSMIAKDVDPETVEKNSDYVPKYEELFTGPGMGSNGRDAREDFSGAEEDARELVNEFCEELDSGDLILFSFSDRNEWAYGDVSHVVMYAGTDDKGNHMIVEEYSTGHDAYYRPIDDLIFGKSHWQTRLPVYGVSYMTSEQRERFTVPE